MIDDEMFLLERTGVDRVTVYSGKNRGGMDVERLRERLIKELTESGKTGGEKGRKRIGETEKAKKFLLDGCETKIRFELRFLLSPQGGQQNVLSEQTKTTLCLTCYSMSIQISFSVLC